MNIYKIAKKYIFSKNQSGLTRTMLILAIFGISIGITALINVSSVMNGFTYEMYKKISNGPHVYINSDNKTNVSSYIEKKFDIKQSSTYQLLTDKYFTTIKDYAGLVKFYSDTEFKKISSINGVSINSETADNLNVELGESIIFYHGVYYPNNTAKTINESEAIRFKVRNIDDSLSTGIHIPKAIWEDESMIQASYRYQESIMLDNFLDSRNAYELIKNNPNMDVFWWGNHNKNFLDMLNLETMIIKIVIFFILVISCFNIISTNILIVAEKKTDIYILRTLGYSKAFIYKLFILIGLIIGIMGVFIGVTLGLFVLENLNEIMHFIELNSSINFHGITDKGIPSFISYEDLSKDICIVIMMILISSILPAIKASRISPADGLKDE